jgi:hypothetical protein
MPSAEYLTAFASIATFLVIAVTAIVGVIQLRHIHGANQLTGLLHLTEAWRSDALQGANKFIREELPGKLRDPKYRAELMVPDPDRRTHPELMVADMLEQTGSYVKYGMIDGEQFLDLTNSYIIHMWDSLKEVVLLRRAASGGNSMYENLEYLAVRAQDFENRFKDGNYPRGTRRLVSDAEWQNVDVH